MSKDYPDTVTAGGQTYRARATGARLYLDLVTEKGHSVEGVCHLRSWDQQPVKQEVPWAEGRRALIRPLPTMGWEEARAEVSSTGEHVWVEVRPRDALAWADSVPRAPVPGQHTCCFEVGDHAHDCARGKRIEENLALGVPAFWAEWAMWVFPPPSAVRGTLLLFFSIWSSGCLEATRPGHIGWPDIEDGDAWLWANGTPGNCGRPLIALGPEGPTLAPWGLK